MTGSPLKIDHLIQLKIAKNPETGNYYCPVSMKDFTESTKIVVIRTTGHVYSAKVVDELNKKQKNWKDLINGTKFRPKDILVLQDPMEIKKRIIDGFLWKKHGKSALDFRKNEENEDELKSIEMTALGKRALEKAALKQKNDTELGTTTKKLKGAEKANKPVDLDEVLSVKDFLKERARMKDWRHGKQTTGMMAASVTSSLMTHKTEDELRSLNTTEMLHQIWYMVKSQHMKTYIQMETSMGTLNCVLYSDQAARTCFSFLDLVYQGKFKNMKFETLIEGTIIQLGSNKARQIKLERVDKSEKLKHDQGGLLTVEMSGDLNTLGVTLAKSSQLDLNYSVFGRIAGGFSVIKEVSDYGNVEGNVMVADFVVKDIQVISDGFRQACKKIRRKLMGIDKKKEKELKMEEAKKERNSRLNRILML